MYINTYYLFFKTEQHRFYIRAHKTKPEQKRIEHTQNLFKLI